MFDRCNIQSYKIEMRNHKIIILYVYVAAKSSQQTLDFGLMANPAASNRNQGLYACYDAGDGPSLC